MSVQTDGINWALTIHLDPGPYTSTELFSSPLLTYRRTWLTHMGPPHLHICIQASSNTLSPVHSDVLGYRCTEQPDPQGTDLCLSPGAPPQPRLPSPPPSRRAPATCPPGALPRRHVARRALPLYALPSGGASLRTTTPSSPRGRAGPRGVRGPSPARDRTRALREGGARLLAEGRVLAGGRRGFPGRGQ